MKREKRNLNQLKSKLQISDSFLVYEYLILDFYVATLCTFHQKRILLEIANVAFLQKYLSLQKTADIYSHRV